MVASKHTQKELVISHFNTVRFWELYTHDDSNCTSQLVSHEMLGNKVQIMPQNFHSIGMTSVTKELSGILFFFQMTLTHVRLKYSQNLNF